MIERGETRVAVDLVIFGLVEGELSVLMGRRPHAPYEGFWALPGEFRHSGQPVDELARNGGGPGGGGIPRSAGAARGGATQPELHLRQPQPRGWEGSGGGVQGDPAEAG